MQLGWTTRTLCALLASTAFAATASAQITSSGKVYKQLDENGVDLTQLTFDLAIPAGSVGQGEALLPLVQYFSGAAGNNLQTFFNRRELGTTVTIDVTVGDRKETFSGAKTATSFTSAQGSGAILTKISAEEYRYTPGDGSETRFVWPAGLVYQNGATLFCASGQQSNCDLLADTNRSPSGKTLTYGWTAGEKCTFVSEIGKPVYDCIHFYRLESVSNSFGYKVSFTYQSDNAYLNSGPPQQPWYKQSGATYWNGQTQIGSSSLTSPATGVTDLTDSGGRTWRVTSSTGYFGVRRPGALADTTAVSFNAGLKVTQVIKDGVTTNYAFVDGGTTRTVTITNALGQQTIVASDLTLGRPISVRDGLNRTTSFAYDGSGRQTGTTFPEGNSVQLTYDARGNAIQSRTIAKPGSGLADLVVSAAYPATCTNVVTCNQPTTTTDVRGSITDYTYDGTHGGVLAVTAPAPTAGAVRPQSRLSYTPVTTASGSIVTLPSGTSACQTLASCVGTADEARTSIVYDPKGNVISQSSGNGSGTLTATAAMTYDLTGNLLTVDGPLSGAADTSVYRYNASREIVGTVSPDPDGTGALKHRAVRTTYRSDGQVAKVERGTVNSQSDADWAAFAPLESVDIGYDANARAITRMLSGGATAYALTQTSYDALGRPDCSATRMNPAAYGALPASACSLGTQGSFGPDRIARTIYDAAGQVTQHQVGVGTSDQANEASFSYTNNGKLYTLIDGENNLTAHVYDGHDRLSKTYFPNPNKGALDSNGSDYEQPTYDAASNVVQWRLRNGNLVNATYDLLNRRISLSGTGVTDRTYGYDLLGRMTNATYASGGANFAATFDALGRQLTEVGRQGTATSVYDIGGRRTQLTYPTSGLFLTYDYLVTGEMTAIRENGAASGVGVLASFGYDDLGRRVSIARGNGTATAYAYDPVSRLASLTQDLAGTASDLTISSMTYNPASQIVSQARSNDAYAWTGHYNVNRAYASNGRNQYTQSGSIAPTYDGRGNLTSAGTTIYDYTGENRLKTAGPTSLTYDPLGRLTQMTTGTTTTRLGYDGSNMIGEYSGTNAVQRRFVHGPGSDEPLVQYEGAGLTDRRWLHADERGSIVAITDSAGNAIAKNSYDDYGIPGSLNAGRFQYTGQVWLSEIGMQYSKARIYSPTLGRFLQTDPIGTKGGINLYAYVGNDPVNLTDPSGLVIETGCTSRITVTCVTQDGGIAGADGRSEGGAPSGGGVDSSSGECILRCDVPRFGRYDQYGNIVVSAGPVYAQRQSPRWSMPAGREHAISRPRYDPSVNYCGGTGSTQLPNNLGVSINDICYDHDQCYNRSGTPRPACDARFGLAITRRMTIYGPAPDPVLRFGQAVGSGLAGYIIVTLGGRDFYAQK